MKKLSIVLSASLIAVSAGGQTPRLGIDPVSDVINAMTLEEKVRLLIGNGMKDQDDNQGAVVGETRDLVPGAAGTTYAIPRLGIPSIVLADGPAGLRINPTREGDSRTYYATHFPIGTLLASSWDTALVEEVGKSIGNEVLEYGVDVLLAPGMNIHRHPLNGRNFEYYSEDPLVTGKMAAAYVRGVQSNGVGTSVKHFAANNQETNRTANDARLSQRALREIYLKGFEITLHESDPWTVMSSYNLINGTYAPENYDLITTVLRDEWNYPGTVMTDWFGGIDASAIVASGNDMLQPGFRKQYDDILAAVKDGKLNVNDIDRNVARILELILRTPRFKGYIFSNNPDLEAHAATTRRSATEGMVLLQNENYALPFAPAVRDIALFGTTSYDFVPGGTGSGNVNRKYTVSLLEGLGNTGYRVDKDLKELYDKHIAAEKIRLAPDPEDKFASWLPPVVPDEPLFDASQMAAIAAANDVAVITVGRYSGEFVDRETSNFELSENNKKLIDDVSKAFHKEGKPVVVILNVGGPMETMSWKDKVDAILLAWQGGQEGGNSVADLLSGKANPSGKLTMTFPVGVRDAYSSVNFPIDLGGGLETFFDMDRKRGNVKNVDYTDYDEDIYVGYRYFDTFGKDVSFPFGFGLSYTNFEYGNPSIEYIDGQYVVKQPVTNVGRVSGKEVVQLYVTAPDATSADKPIHELKAFGKTRMLKPGETEILVLSVPESELASFNEEISAWQTTPGEYSFMTAASSRDIRHSMKADVKASERKVNNVLAPKVELNILKR